LAFHQIISGRYAPTSLTAFGDKKAKVILVMTFASVLSIQFVCVTSEYCSPAAEDAAPAEQPRLPTASIAKVEGSGTTVRTALSNQADPPPYSSSSTFTCVVPDWGDGTLAKVLIHNANIIASNASGGNNLRLSQLSIAGIQKSR